jgi:hypothetical protein
LPVRSYQLFLLQDQRRLPLKRTILVTAFLAALVGAVLLWPVDSNTVIADKDENMQELIDLMEEAVNTTGPARAPMVGPPVEEDDGARGSVSVPLPLATNGNPYGCYGLTENPHWSDNGVDASVHAKSECGANEGASSGRPYHPLSQGV